MLLVCVCQKVVLHEIEALSSLRMGVVCVVCVCGGGGGGGGRGKKIKLGVQTPNEANHI